MGLDQGVRSVLGNDCCQLLCQFVIWEKTTWEQKAGWVWLSLLWVWESGEKMCVSWRMLFSSDIPDIYLFFLFLLDFMIICVIHLLSQTHLQGVLFSADKLESGRVKLAMLMGTSAAPALVPVVWFRAFFFIHTAQLLGRSPPCLGLKSETYVTKFDESEYRF